MKKNNDFINQRHPKYLENISDVLTYKSCYLNKDFVSESTLPRFSREWYRDYYNRKKRALHINLFHELVQIPMKAIFSDKAIIRREFGKYSDLSTMIQNIDGRGRDINLIMRELGIRALVGKQSYAYICSPQPYSYKEPYVVPMWFDRIVNWNSDLSNNFNWAMITEKTISQDDPKYHPEQRDTILVLTKDYYERYDIDSQKIVEQGENFAGIVPVVKVLLTDADDDGIGEGWGDKLVPFDVEILRVLSLYQQEMYLLLFNILTMPKRGERDAAELVKIISEHNILTYDPSISPPKFLSPEINTMKEKMDYIRWLIDMERYMAGFKGKDEVVEKSQSGIAKLFDYISTSETISSIAASLERAEYNLLYIYGIYAGVVDKSASLNDFKEQISINYPRSFNVLDLEKQLDNLYKFISSGISSSKATSKAQELITQIQLNPYLTKTEKQMIEDEFKNLEAASDVLPAN